MFSARRRFGIPGVIAAAILTALALAPAAGAAPPVLWEAGAGTGAGQLNTPRGSAADPDTGHIFVAEQLNRRISEFTAWGVFVKTWGWDVVASGPGDRSDTVAPEFEICVPANGDVCKEGVQGSSGVGQFNVATSVALDSAGNVYVFDFSARRVQKFSPAGQFLLMFGGGVNQGPGNPGNLCTAAHIAAGDTCGAGASGTADGQFGAVAALSTLLAIGADDKVYVGDVGRIQRFNTAGEHQANMTIAGETVNHLAVDTAGDLYAAYREIGNVSKPNVVKLAPVDGAAGAPLATFAASNPRGLAVAPNGDVYVFNSGGFEDTGILHFNASAVEVEPLFGEGLNFGSTGLSVNDVTCGDGGIAVYHSNNSPSFLRAFGPAPDPACAGPPPAAPPSINAQYAAAVDTDNALLKAQINPHFWEDTTYYVQYGTASCIEAEGWEGGCVQQQPPTPAALNAGVVAEDVTTAGVFLSGLQPDTTYHYRFVAESGGGGPVRGVGGTETTDGQEASFTTYPPPLPHRADCPNQAFRDGSSAHLTDCRAYELVSPIDKEGADLAAGNSTQSMEQSASDGDALTYSAIRAFGQPRGAPAVSQYLTRREAGKEWVSEAITPPREGEHFAEIVEDLSSLYKAFSEDLCSAWNWHPTEPTLAAGAIAGFQNLYRRDNCGAGAGGFEALTTVAPAEIEVPEAFVPAIQGFSADGSISALRAPGQLRGDLPPCSPEEQSTRSCTRRVYATQGGTLRLLSVLPDGTPSEARENSAGTGFGQLVSHTTNSVHRAVSADGSRVYWSAGTDALYVRLNPMAATESPPDAEGNCVPDPALACTLEIAQAPFTRYWSAAADGHKAIYSVGLLSGSGAQLFEFDLATRTSSPIAGGVVGVAGTSEDASQVYFASRQVLSEEPNSEGDTAQDGKPNLYHYVAGEGGGEGSYAFVATLAEADNVPETDRFSPVHARPDVRTARVSPGGGHLAFTSTARATGYDNTDLQSGEADAEVFLYDAAAEKLVCVSCNPSGARPAGRLVGQVEQPTAATIPGWPSQTYPSRALAADGGRLFFESYDALVLADTNGQKDVYQWQAVSGEGAQGSQECEQLGAELHVGASGGCLSLISSGTSPQESTFIDASAGGRDVFIRTASSLVAHDPGLRDLYDAREGGGLPPPPTPPAGCEGEACQGIASAPEDPTPASTAYQGSSNVTTIRRRCPKGKRAVRKAGRTRCLRRRCPKGKRAVRKAGKTRCLRKQGQRQRRRANHDGRAHR